MIQALYDIRFAFDSDNPFEQDTTKTCLNKLKKYFAENAETFTGIDYLNASKYLLVCPDLKTIFGKDVNRETHVSEELNAEIKAFIKENVPKLSEDLEKWVNENPLPRTSTLSNNVPLSTLVGGNAETSDIETALADIGSNMILPPMDGKFSQSLSIGLQYDISSDKALNYEEVCKLCMNISRTKLVESNNVVDPTILALEKEKRKKLIYEISRYKSNTLINPLVDEDISSMSLEQLETCLEQCKRLQENFKTLEIFRRGFSAGGTIYGAVFPEGIPIGKTKRLCFKGIGKEVLNTLFNNTTTTGIAFQNILDKNNIHISDELLTLVAFGEICLSKVEIKNVDPDEKKNTDEDVYTVEELGRVKDAIKKESSKSKGKGNDNMANQKLKSVETEEYYDEEEGYEYEYEDEGETEPPKGKGK